MFKRREISDQEQENRNFLSECTSATSYQRCTHVNVLDSSFGVPVGIYEYLLSGWLVSDKIPMIMVEKSKLLSGLGKKSIEMLTHTPTLNQIIEDQELLKQSNNENSK